MWGHCWTPIGVKVRRLFTAFLGSEDWHGALVVHGHTPTRSGAPDLRANRVNLDTGACFARPLTAAAFGDLDTAPPTFSTATACNSNWHRSGATRFEC
jgi:serine/threonine protein phosphatase 1